MEIKLAKNYGFCFGVKRAIKIAEESPNSTTIGPLIHNNEEINRLKTLYNVNNINDFSEVENIQKAIIRTHGITKENLKELKDKNIDIVDATCPFVSKPQKICEEMSKKGYQIVIFGDINHPEVKGVMSYAENGAIVALKPEDLEDISFQNKVAIIAQTTRKFSEYTEIVNYIMPRCKEVRVFNTICNATFENQEAVRELSKECDIIIIVGGKNSSNTKQLYTISKSNCEDSYLIENENELKKEWFEGKNICGISAGASTPDWIIQKVMRKIKEF
ncbi:MAG: 4-hydroxy-3-methylbut-2-enyl diphosphate reductase [Epsilonproteobacteria bacterium]|nr:4-hydroxy-3-methylbut-2-enyl diphosphate reductase [Campylobacterota bacterium]